MKKIVLLFLLIFSFGAQAQMGVCTDGLRTSVQVNKAIDFSQRTLDKLNSIEGKVFLVGRVGQELSKYNLNYSHGAFVYKLNNQWVAVHSLNVCGTNTSGLYQEGISSFLLDDMFIYGANISAIKEPYSNQLLALLQNSKQLMTTHTSSYNMLAYPFDTKYQNSNSWVLETMMRSVALTKNIPISSREKLQDYLQSSGYRGNIIEVSALTRLGTSPNKTNLAFDDQPLMQRMTGQINTSTYDGIVKFFIANGYIDTPVEVR